MQDQRLLFQSFSDARLIEVVKNAKQFGYDNNIRALALEILSERGISENDLQLTGNLANDKFDRAEEFYKSYDLVSKIAFGLYLLLLIVKAIAVFHLFGVYAGAMYTTFYWIVLIVTLGALLKSFLDHMNFYKVIGKELGAGDQIVYIVLGMPFYIFMFFFYRSRMKEEMLMIR